MAIDHPGATTSRLTIDDWVQAGFAILAQEGMTALKIDRLCSRLTVTKGSFYWHFTDIAGYRETLIEAWGELPTRIAAISATWPASDPASACRK
jgi:AcrR family transcriptional regulator